MVRLRILVSGLVQGVGFRPFVRALAVRCAVSGFVRNEGDRVRIEVEGEAEAVRRFRAELTDRPPAAAHVADVSVEEMAPSGVCGFDIEPSRDPTVGPNFVPADVATCPGCLAELFDPADRRHRYPFIACAACGPRFTVITAVSYDRERTTMAAFPLCPACRREYADPADRRFHAQSTACPDCGPRLSLLGAGGSAAAAGPLAAAVAALRHGKILAVKGLGGFHLACDARRADAVAELRRRKGRDEKPLAVMVADVATAGALCEIGPGEAELLDSPERPIVLLRRAGGRLADAVAPGTQLLGVVLPYTALHHLLLHDFGGPLVMTSGNRADEPIACTDADAGRRLAGIADLVLSHDRVIQSRSDDSVLRVAAGVALPVRRSRGYAPLPLTLPVPCRRPVLATGGHLKAVFALGRDGHAILSQHLGDLDGYDASRAYAEAVADFERLFRFRPAVIAHDLHPDYASTRYARERAAAEPGVRPVAVQHHHAHMASCMAENGLNEPVIGVTFDGTGYGTDGTIWGGEFLVGDYRGFRRAAHLRPVPLPGGDAAAREPWRAALAHLLDAGEGPAALADRIDPRALRTVARMTDRRLNAPLTSSAGRLFDAVASLIGVRDRAGYEGQAAAELEGLAARAEPDREYPFAVDAGGGPLRVDTRPLVAAVVADVRRAVPREVIARRFHSTLVAVIADVCRRIRAGTGPGAVALSGGVFLNAILLTESLDRLTRDGFRAYRHAHVPPGDGGLCLGQLAVAAALESCDDSPRQLP